MNAKMILQEIQNIHFGLITSRFIKIDQLLGNLVILYEYYSAYILMHFLILLHHTDISNYFNKNFNYFFLNRQIQHPWNRIQHRAA